MSGYFDQEGNKCGFWYEYNSFGRLKKESFFSGNLNGLEQEWYDNGDLSREGLYINDNKVDVWNYWHPNNILSKKESYLNNLLHGSYYTWNSKGNLTTEGYYDQGKKHGIWPSYYDNGQIKSEIHFEHNTMTFKQKWHSNGQLEFETYYDNGVSCGLQREWYPNSSLRSEYYTYQGKYFGLYQIWNSGGILTSKGLYLDDKKTGLWMQIENKETTYGEYCNDKKSGLWRHFLGSILIYEEEYDNGLEHGEKTKYYPNGNISFCGKYENGFPTGPWRYYYPNGNIAASGNYCYSKPRFSVWDPYGKYIGERFIQRSIGLSFYYDNEISDGLSMIYKDGLPKINYYRNGICQSYEVCWSWDRDNIRCIMSE